MSDEQVAEFSGVAAGTNNPVVWLHSNVYDGGKLLATYDTNGLHLHFADWLGTNRVQMNANGTMEETCISMPFGDSMQGCGSATDSTEHHFTGKEHDFESGLDYFGARYYGSNMGRWMSPDWAAKAEPIPYAKMDSPQSLNLYAYVENNPLWAVDADGHQFSMIAPSPICTGGGCDSDVELNSNGAQEEARDKLRAAHVAEAAQKAQQQNTQGHTVPPGHHAIDKDAIVTYADQHAEKGSLHKCATYCRKAFEAGGVDTSGHPVDAKDWGPTLLKNGAVVVPKDGYIPEKADVVVFAGNDAHPIGHIAIYDGRQWVSDFKQRNMSPYTISPPSTIYRFPDN